MRREIELDSSAGGGGGHQEGQHDGLVGRVGQRHEAAQEAGHHRGMRQRMAGRQDQDHLEGEAEDGEDAGVPGADDNGWRAFRCDQQGQDGGDGGQSDRQHERIGHVAFEQVDEHRRDRLKAATAGLRDGGAAHLDVPGLVVFRLDGRVVMMWGG
jgi:hypothetical protein